MKSHFLKENDVVLSSRWQFQDGRSKGMGTEWDKEVVGKVDPQKRVLCLAQGFLHLQEGARIVDSALVTDGSGPIRLHLAHCRHGPHTLRQVWTPGLKSRAAQDSE